MGGATLTLPSSFFNRLELQELAKLHFCFLFHITLSFALHKVENFQDLIKWCMNRQSKIGRHVQICRCLYRRKAETFVDRDFCYYAQESCKRIGELNRARDQGGKAKSFQNRLFHRFSRISVTTHIDPCHHCGAITFVLKRICREIF